ncbi:MAG: PIN domain-containing protein [Dehalococcoidia bacterium]|nr:MAG: PIN domain-containing protein [Dehalococcoidia bacterium]
MIYADTSALVKLVLTEPESSALLVYLRGRGDVVTSALAQTELVRTVRRLEPDLEPRARALIAGLIQVEVGGEVLAAAAALSPPELRTLDAVHLATALALGGELDAVVTYDARMAAAARSAGLRVEAPA